MVKISVIIPVYNANKYLERCLKSIIEQTFKDIEIICVDDCSTDNSLKILQNFAKKDNRIKIVHCNTNGGESRARNIGLDNAFGEYLSFVDNDDFLDLDFYEKLYSKASKTGADIVKGEAKIYRFDGKTEYDNYNLKIKETGSKFFFINYWWTAIYKSELIKCNNIRFLEGYKLGGDSLFLNEAILCCKNLEIVNNVYYNYIVREDSTNSNVLSQDKIKSALYIYGKIIDNILNKVENDADKKYLLEWCLQCPLVYAFRLKTNENLNFCIDVSFDFYNKIKYYIDKDLTFLPLILNYLKNNDKEGLKDFYIKNNTQQKMISANLRFICNQKGKHAKSINNNPCI